MPQEEINAILVSKALEGNTVVRLKGGDPFVFGRGGEEISALLENEIPFDIVPGISSSIAAAELSGIPVTHRNVSRSFHIITGHTSDDKLPEDMSVYARLSGTLVFLMGLSKLEFISKSLIEYGKSRNTPVAVISNGATGKSRTVRGSLSNISLKVKEYKVEPPAIIVVGETALLDFSPTICKPLEGRSVTVTGTRTHIIKLRSELEMLGAYVEGRELLQVNEYNENTQFENALTNIENYSVLILTSVNGVDIFKRKISALGIDIRRFANVKFAVIGSGTEKALRELGINADILPNEYNTISLAVSLCNKVKSDDKVLILRAKQGSEDLTRILSENTVDFEEIKIYDVINSDTSEGSLVDTDFLTFSSSSGVRAFFECGYSISNKIRIICIGKRTSETLLEYGIDDFGVAKTSNIDGIIEKITNCI